MESLSGSHLFNWIKIVLLNVVHSIKEITCNKKEKQLSKPPTYAVVMHNDNYTTMECVVYILHHFFGHSTQDALELMLTIHHKNKGICGIYPAEIAEMKLIKVRRYVRQHGFPLRCTMEKISG